MGARGMTVSPPLLLLLLSLAPAQPLLRTDHRTDHRTDQWGLMTEGGVASSRSVNNMALEGLLSIYRGQTGDRPHFLEDFAHFRNDNSNEGGDQSGRRMSITNAMDILRDRLMRAIKRKHVNLDNRDGVWSEPGLVSIG